MYCKTKWNAKKVKFIENCRKNWVKSTKYASWSVVFSKPLKIPPARGTRSNEKKCTFTLVKNDSNECKTNSECRKVKCGANHNKNWSKSTKYASCTYSR